MGTGKMISKNCFTKRHTNILKGIAVILLVIHHSFPAIPKEYLHEQALLITQLVSAAKLCVGIFAVLSGYGMYMSYQKHLQKEDSLSTFCISMRFSGSLPYRPS